MMPVDVSRRIFLIGSGASAAVLMLSACSTTSVLAPIEAGTSQDMTEPSLQIVNRIRRAKGLSSVAFDPVAANAARDQAIRMSRYGRMEHLLGSDKTFLARMKRMQVTLPAAENIASGQDSTEAAIEAWRRSKKHLENMLGHYGGMGVAVASNDQTGGRPYWAMVLSNPKSAFSLMPT